MERFATARSPISTEQGAQIGIFVIVTPTCKLDPDCDSAPFSFSCVSVHEKELRPGANHAPKRGQHSRPRIPTLAAEQRGFATQAPGVGR